MIKKIPMRRCVGCMEQKSKRELIRVVRSPEGEIVDVFGEPGDNNAEMHAILAEFDLPYGYPEEVEKEAEKIPERSPTRRSPRDATCAAWRRSRSIRPMRRISTTRSRSAGWKTGTTRSAYISPT